MPKKIDPYGLQFNVSQLLKETTGADRHYEVNTLALDVLDEHTEVLTPLVGRIRFLRTGADILVTGTLATAIQKECGRCLDPFTAPITIELEEQFYPTIDVNTGLPLPPPDEADEANRINDQHILDLLEVVRQAAVLEGDSVRYCKPDCKGICLQCGQNLNETTCDCQTETVDLRWAGLLEKLRADE